MAKVLLGVVHGLGSAGVDALGVAGCPSGREVKVYWEAEYGEYCCKLVGAPDADYFTDDFGDALGTAKSMANRGCTGEIAITGLKLLLKVEKLERKELSAYTEHSMRKAEGNYSPGNGV